MNEQLHRIPRGKMQVKRNNCPYNACSWHQLCSRELESFQNSIRYNFFSDAQLISQQRDFLCTIGVNL